MANIDTSPKKKKNASDQHQEFQATFMRIGNPTITPQFLLRLLDYYYYVIAP